MNSNKDLRERLGKNDRIYQNLAHLHRQEHDKENCFCTTEISGVYRNVLDEIEKLISSEREAAVIEELELFSDVHRGDSNPKGGNWCRDINGKQFKPCVRCVAQDRIQELTDREDDAYTRGWEDHEAIYGGEYRKHDRM